MDMKPGDQHWLFSRSARTVRAFDHTGKLIFQAEARNRTVNDSAPVNERWAPCPPGEYVFGAPVHKDTPPFGPWFVPIEGPNMVANGRSGIGWHGGGSGLPDPLADVQSPPWVVTHGCERSRNIDLCRGVALILDCQHAGGTAHVTVESFVRGTPGDADDWMDVAETDLDPDE